MRFRLDKNGMDVGNHASRHSPKYTYDQQLYAAFYETIRLDAILVNNSQCTFPSCVVERCSIVISQCSLAMLCTCALKDAEDWDEVSLKRK